MRRESGSFIRSFCKGYGSDGKRINLYLLSAIYRLSVRRLRRKIIANELYINREEGFIGTALKKDEFVANCSDIDDVIVFFRDGKYIISVTLHPEVKMYADA